MNELIYNDIINDEVIKFHSDAEQSEVDSLEWIGEWYHVKKVLVEKLGYKVIENPNLN
jgi:hypothetical protein